MRRRVGVAAAIVGGTLRAAASFAPALIQCDLCRETLYIAVDAFLGLVGGTVQGAGPLFVWSGVMFGAAFADSAPRRGCLSPTKALGRRRVAPRPSGSMPAPGTNRNGLKSGSPDWLGRLACLRPRLTASQPAEWEEG